MNPSARNIVLGLLLILSFALVATAATASVDTEARKYILRGESASYFILNTTEGKTYYVVQIDDKNSFVFDEKVNIVQNEQVLVEVLKEYYLQSGATGFTEASKAELLNKFNQSFVSFGICHDKFYNLRETNFLYSQYNCLTPAVGAVCDAAFASRKRARAAWDAFKLKVDLLPAADTKEKIADALAQIEEAGKSAKNETVNFDDPNLGYAFFFPTTMDKDPTCKFNYAYLDDVIYLSSPAMRNKITDVNSEAKDLIRTYNSRKDVTKVKEIQNEGKELLEKGINLTSLIRVKFAPLEEKMKALEASYDKLKEANTLDSATTSLNNMNIAYKALESLISDPKGILYSYNKTVFTVEAAKGAIDGAKKKYGDGDNRVINLNNEYVGVVRELAIADQKLQNKTDVKAEELNAIALKAESVRGRAANLQPKQNELDLTTWAAIVVLIAAVIGVIVYVVKFRKKGPGGKEMDIKTIMGTGGDKRRVEREEIDKEQHRRAMFPKL